MNLKPKDQQHDVHYCARCYGDHKAVIFRPFEICPSDGGYTHWGWCPTTNEPILFKEVQTISK